MIFIGAALSFIGSLPPGIISLTVAETTLRKGMSSALILSAGASFVEFLQSFIAIRFAEWLNQNGIVGSIIEILAIPIFLGIGIYHLFFLHASRPSTSGTDSGLSDFFKGMFVSSLNLLVFPYWIFYGFLFKSNGLIDDRWFSLLIFSFGVGIGTFCLLWLYALLSHRIISRFQNFAQSMNRTVGIIFLILGVVQLIRVI